MGSVRNSSVEWYVVQKGPHKDKKLLVGSARVVTDGGQTYQVEAAQKGRGPKICVWSGVDPFSAGEIADKINAGNQVPEPEPVEEYGGVMELDPDPSEYLKPAE